MKVRLITFSDDNMDISRMHCVGGAMSPGGMDDARSYTPWHINGDSDGVPEIRKLYRAHKSLFDAARGCGYWAWKPTLIYYYALWRPSLFGIDEGDVIVYADAGVEFIAPVSHIIDRMDQDIFLFGNNWEHAHWCKRDVVASVWNQHTQRLGRNGPRTDARDYDALDDGANWSLFGKQAQASVIFFRVTDWTRTFVDEWLRWCLASTYKRINNGPMERHGYLIDDSPSQMPNHPEFQEHRHDQAILTTLAYREGIRLHYWPAVYNKGGSPEFIYEKLPEYASDDYPVLFSHHRKRNHEWSNAA